MIVLLGEVKLQRAHTTDLHEYACRIFMYSGSRGGEPGCSNHVRVFKVSIESARTLLP